jgi:cytochrome c55X
MLKMGGLIAGAVLMTAFGSAGTVRGADAAAGNQLYHTYCSVCHGPRLLNSGARAADLRKMTPGMSGRFKKIVREGKRGPKGEMPAWSDILTKEEIADIWAYVKTKGK